ncbi:hypothetical protein BC834DRAFT_990443 [Gloeopeniophorella convolvens]|nr:hypothetical protein BC834DRAFT_990443 [Gloeopeniophorella convolvens]
MVVSLWRACHPQLGSLPEVYWFPLLRNYFGQLFHSMANQDTMLRVPPWRLPSSVTGSDLVQACPRPMMTGEPPESIRFNRMLRALHLSHVNVNEEAQSYALLSHILTHYAWSTIYGGASNFVSSPQYPFKVGKKTVIPDFCELLVSDEGTSRTVGWWWEAKKIFGPEPLSTSPDTSLESHFDSLQPSFQYQFEFRFPQILDQAKFAFKMHHDIHIFHSFWSSGAFFVLIQWVRAGHEDDQKLPWPIPPTVEGYKTLINQEVERLRRDGTSTKKPSELTGKLPVIPPRKIRSYEAQARADAKDLEVRLKVLQKILSKFEDERAIIPRIVYFCESMFEGDGRTFGLSGHFRKALRIASKSPHLNLSFMPSLFDPPNDETLYQPSLHSMELAQKSVIKGYSNMISNSRLPFDQCRRRMAINPHPLATNMIIKLWLSLTGC